MQAPGHLRQAATARPTPALRPRLATLAALLVLAGCQQQPPAEAPLRVVRTISVSTIVDRPELELAAEVRARTETRLAFRVGGKLVARAVEVGDVVHAGQILARLDPTDLQAGASAARAQREAARVQRDQARADLNRFRELRDQGFISGAEFERRETALRAASAQLDQADAQLAVQANQARYATLRADAEGVVVGADAEVGAVLGAGQPVLRIARNGERDAVFVVPENRRELALALQAQATPLPVRLWGSDAPVQARIREVAAAADPMSRTFQVRATLSQAHLAPGQTATIVLPLPERQGAHLPLAAVFARDGRPHVWVVEGEPHKLRAQAVVVEPAADEMVRVTAGLQAGEVVVTAGAHVLEDGQVVRVLAAGAGRT